MPHFTHDDIFDLALNGIKNNCDLMVLTAGEPTSYANANAANGVGAGQKIAQAPMAAGDFTLAMGDTSGRKVTAAAKAAQTVDTAGNGDHVAYLDTVNLKILHFYPIAVARNGLIVGDSVNFPAHDLEFTDTIAE